MRNRHVLGAGLVLSMLLSSCAMSAASTPHAEPSLSDLAGAALDQLPGVASVALTEIPPVDGDDPALSSVSLAVTVTEVATVDEVVAVAEATADFSKENAEKHPWVASVAVENIDHEPDDDILSQSPAGFEVFPNVRVSAGADAREIMEFLALPGVEVVAVTQGFPHVMVATASDLASARDFASGLELWRDGGSIWAEDGRVRLMEVPERLTDDGMDVIIATSIAYPTTQFWLEAPKAGPRWPRLYIDQVSEQDASGITAALTEPTLRAAMVNDYELEFVIRANTADGTTVDSVGLVGPPS